MSIRERITDGLNNKFEGLNNGFNRINDYIYNVQRACYTLIGGGSGSGKTTLLDFIIINLLKDAEAKNIVVNIFYYSLEIDKVSKQANWLSVLVYINYDRIISPQKIKGLGNLRLDEDEQQLVDSCIEELEVLMNKITWEFVSTNPTGIYYKIWEHFENRGRFEYETYTNSQGEEDEKIVKYINNNPDEYNILALDHAALLTLERGFNTKQNLDKFSEYLVTFRNLFGLTSFILQQFNNGLSSIERIKYSGKDLSPQQGDFRDSGNLYIDSDVAIGLLNPKKVDMEDCMGYNITGSNADYKLNHVFRLFKIIKNRLGRDDISFGLLFNANSGQFEELPPPNQLTEEVKQKIRTLVRK